MNQVRLRLLLLVVSSAPRAAAPTAPEPPQPLRRGPQPSGARSAGYGVLQPPPRSELRAKARPLSRLLSP